MLMKLGRGTSPSAGSYPYSGEFFDLSKEVSLDLYFDYRDLTSLNDTAEISTLAGMSGVGTNPVFDAFSFGGIGAVKANGLGTEMLSDSTISTANGFTCGVVLKLAPESAARSIWSLGTSTAGSANYYLAQQQNDADLEFRNAQAGGAQKISDFRQNEYAICVYRQNAADTNAEVFMNGDSYAISFDPINLGGDFYFRLFDLGNGANIAAPCEIASCFAYGDYLSDELILKWMQRMRDVYSSVPTYKPDVNMLYIGDSIMDGVFLNAKADFVAEMQKYVRNALAIDCAIGSACLTEEASTAGGGSYWFYDISAGSAGDAYSSVEDVVNKDDVTEIVICLGTNDASEVTDGTITTAQWKAAYIDFIDVLKAAFTNARILIIPQRVYTDSHQAARQTMRTATEEIISSESNVYLAIDYDDVTLHDTVHPDAAGYQTMAVALAQRIASLRGLL